MSGTHRKYELKARAEQVAQTRLRIVAAAAALHVEVGPARTTMAEIARRAGVRRATVYNHFPDDGQLFAACGDYSLSRNPPPDPARALARADPVERVRGVLVAYYPWYRTMAPGLEKLYRDRAVLPGLDTAMAARMDQRFAGLVETLAAGFARRGRAHARVHAAIGLALDFSTWRRLTRDGLPDTAAAALMVDTTRAAARPQPRPRPATPPRPNRE